MNVLTPTEARSFCDEWLPVWTGDRPELLVNFYAEDAFYLDPAVPDGFLNKWRAAIPVGGKTLDVTVVCLVQLNESGRSRRIEVYFDRSELLREIAKRH